MCCTEGYRNNGGRKYGNFSGAGVVDNNQQFFTKNCRVTNGCGSHSIP